VNVSTKYIQWFHVHVTSTIDKISLTCQTVFKERGNVKDGLSKGRKRSVNIRRGKESYQQ